jgi:hypothetical protein
MGVNLEPAWEVREEDLEAIATGAAIMGTGGGGNPYLGMLRAREALRRGGRILVVDPDGLRDDALLVASGGMGSPVVAYEKLPQGEEEAEAVRALEEHLGRRVDAVAPLEMGGGNSLAALVAGATLGVPVLDGDGMGRAFPELSMVTYLIYGGAAAPAALADDHGNRVVVSRAGGPAELERIARALTVEMGAHAGLAMTPMDGAHARATCVPRTLSFAKRLGEAVAGARREGADPVDALLGVTGGGRLFRGKVVDVERRLAGGFARGTIRLEAFDADGGGPLEVEFQNENLVVRRGEELLAVVPDLITLVDAETAEPITTELVRFGFRVEVLLIPPSPRLTTPEALRWVGPRAFGYDVDWTPATAAG